LSELLKKAENTGCSYSSLPKDQVNYQKLSYHNVVIS